MRFTFFNLFLFSLFSAIAQQPNLSSSEILLALKKLNTTGSVLYIAAHPDDENTRLLAYLASEKKLRTGYLSITRGDGGQNLIGKEQGEALGLIRTQELLAARRIDGAEQFFTRANDFGYSKNPEETFEFWNKDSVLSDVVLCIRRFRPDVIICRFPTTGEGGHGHHTASAILALEAFEAAADSTRFPAQLKTTTVWQSKRIVWNTFNFGGNNTTAPDQIKIDVGAYNPLTGKSYGEVASESRSMHKSQGFGTAKQRGSNIEYFKLLKGDSVRENLFEGINFSWQRIKKTENLQAFIADCILNYNPSDPSASLRDLIKIQKEIFKIDGKDASAKYWKLHKTKEINNLIIACAGIWAEASASQFSAIPGGELSVTAQIVSRVNESVKLNKIQFIAIMDTSTLLPLKVNEMYSFKFLLKIPSNTSFSNPYWLESKHTLGLYSVNDQSLIGKAFNEPALKAKFEISIFDHPLQIEVPVIYKHTDPVRSEIYRSLDILPPATINLTEKLLIYSDSSIKKLGFVIKANAADIKGRLQLKCSNGWKASIKTPDFHLINKGDETIVEAIIECDQSELQGELNASILIGDKLYDQSIQHIEYDHIPHQFILSKASAKLIKLDLIKAGINIGYIPGAGDEIPANLRQIGYQVTILTDELLAGADLSQYSAVVTGIRAYNTNERLQLQYNKLMEYVKQGGNLIVQYNTNNRIGPVPAKIGPYPFTISRERVTDEKAAVTFNSASHPVVNIPNKITEKDFEGWVQERGIYFATDYSKDFEAIFSMNDPNDKPSAGSLIIAKLGKGNFVYTGLVFFRELPAGVPGAYRLFVNLLSLPQNQLYER